MKSDMENKDWLNENEALKKISPANPFKVPAGYFDDLGDRIVAFKNIDELIGKGSLEGFTVPENYFNELTDNIKSRITIEEALKTEDAGFTVPEGYFENLQEQINGRIFIEEALGEPAEQFSVPAGYFDKLNQSILNKTVYEKQEAVVVELGARNRGVVRKLFASNAFKYATAACFALVIGGGVLLNELSAPADAHKNSFLHKQLSNVPVDDIKSYLQLNLDPSDTQQTVQSEGDDINDQSLEEALKKDIDNVQ
jgi:hypothetical protein